MPEENDHPTPPDSRPIDLGLVEGKSMGFVPTSAISPQSFPIGGLAPVDGPLSSAPPAPQADAGPAAPAGEAMDGGGQSGGAS